MRATVMASFMFAEPLVARSPALCTNPQVT
jgi:hypothetical protein